MTLTEFLLARIADEDYDARDGGIGPVSSGCWSTGRVIRECEAKRRIVERATVATPVLDYDAGWAFSETLRDLAAVYDAHPDYREEWKP